MRKKDLKKWYWAIDQMDYGRMLKFERRAEVGHPIFRTDLPLWTYFKEKLAKFQEEYGSSSTSSSSNVSTMTGWARTLDPNDVRHRPDH